MGTLRQPARDYAMTSFFKHTELLLKGNKVTRMHYQRDLHGWLINWDSSRDPIARGKNLLSEETYTGKIESLF